MNVNCRNFKSASSRSVSTANLTENTPPDFREYCYYHSKFGVEARQCKQPCKFSSSAAKAPTTLNGSVGVSRNGTSTWHIYDPLTNIDFCLDSGSNKSYCLLIDHFMIIVGGFFSRNTWDLNSMF